MTLRAARPADMAEVGRMLEESRLPRAGLETVQAWVAVGPDGSLQGAVAMERHGDVALLRSLVVRPGRRGTGVGGALLRHAIAQARSSGARQACGLTTTIPQWLSRAGFRRIARDQLPAALSASEELRGACPDSADCFLLDL